MVKGARKECPNCGYETLGNYCSTCGTKLIADEEFFVSGNMNQKQQGFFSEFKKRYKENHKTKLGRDRHSRCTWTFCC